MAGKAPADLAPSFFTSWLLQGVFLVFTVTVFVRRSFSSPSPAQAAAPSVKRGQKSRNLRACPTAEGDRDNVSATGLRTFNHFNLSGAKRHGSGSWGRHDPEAYSTFNEDGKMRSDESVLGQPVVGMRRGGRQARKPLAGRGHLTPEVPLCCRILLRCGCEGLTGSIWMRRSSASGLGSKSGVKGR